MVRRKTVTTRINSAMADYQITSGTAAPEFFGLVQYVSDPIAAQTMSGTVKGRIRGSQSGNGFDGTVAIGIHVFSNDGSILRAALIKAERARGNLSKALTTVEEGLRIAESLRSDLLSPESRASFLANIQSSYQLYTDLLMQSPLLL
jgi:hypothetical protein